MQFPLRREPGIVAVVDDQLPYIEDLILSLPKELAVEAFTVSLEFVETIQEEMKRREKLDLYLREAALRAERGSPVLVEAIKYWSSGADRYNRIQVVCMDYYMDQMSGLSALDLCTTWPGKRILLTGASEDARIFKAFNDKQINRYIPKNSRGLGAEVLSQTREMLDEYANEFEIDWSPWGNTHNRRSQHIFKNPAVGEALDALLGTECEYITTGAPLGVLALGYEGGLRYIAMNTSEELSQVADRSEAAGASADNWKAIRAGEALSNIECVRALNEPLRVSPVGFSVKVEDLDTTVHGAVFELDTPFAPIKDQCFSAWRFAVRQKLPALV